MNWNDLSEKISWRNPWHFAAMLLLFVTIGGGGAAVFLYFLLNKEDACAGGAPCLYVVPNAADPALPATCTLVFREPLRLPRQDVGQVTFKCAGMGEVPIVAGPRTHTVSDVQGVYRGPSNCTGNLTISWHGGGIPDSAPRLQGYASTDDRRHCLFVGHEEKLLGIPILYVDELPELVTHPHRE